jgi:hypothetical protein
MALEEFLEVLAANPELLGVILAIVYNIAGYIMSMLKIKSLEPYQATELAKTLVLFETLFIVLSRIGGLDPKYTTAITVILAVVISLKDKISDLAKAQSS